MNDARAAYVQYIPLESSAGIAEAGKIANLVLNRPSVANAFSGELLGALSELIEEVAVDRSVRLLLVQGTGRHFSGGADLHWMQQAASLDYAGNVQEAEKLTRMFEGLANLHVPTIALVKGAAFGGALGLVAACDYAFALADARFCLSETKIGLLPAVILPYLARKMPAAQLHRQVLTARIFSAAEASQLGLVQAVFSDTAQMEAALREEIQLLLAASPEAQSSYKHLYRDLAESHWEQSPMTATAIAQTRASPMGQAGLAAFFQKTSAPWVQHLPHDCSLVLPTVQRC